MSDLFRDIETNALLEMAEEAKRQLGLTARYATSGVAGSGIGRFKEDVNVFQLLPDVVMGRKMDALNPRPTDIRVMQMKPYGGMITADLLKGLEP